MKMPSVTEKVIDRLKRIKRVNVERLLIVSAAGLVVMLALRAEDNQTVDSVYRVEGSKPAVQTSADGTQAASASAQTPMQSVICWYEDGDGYLVPVTQQVAQQDGIAKATLSLMVKSSQNDLTAARMGLKNILPEGTSFDIDISGGKARVDLSKEALNCMSAEEELLMVHGTAAALCCFDTVEQVSFLFDGQKRSQLTHGTDVSGVFSMDNINVESADVTSSVYADQMQLYFPSASGRMLVPVTRTVFSPADLSTAILELVKGPKKDSGLEQAVQEKCGIRSVTVKNGVATIDFTREFAGIAENDDGGQLAVRAVVFTASQFPGVEKVNILVEGEPFRPAPETATTFVNQASEVMSSYPGVVEMD